MEEPRIEAKSGEHHRAKLRRAEHVSVQEEIIMAQRGGGQGSTFM